MILRFTNEQIYFCLESIWSMLDYRFKFQINSLVSANSDNSYEQSLNIDVPTLLQCYKAVSSKSYGCTVDIAEGLLNSVRDQLLAEANYTEYMTYLAELEADPLTTEVSPNEYTISLIAIQKEKESDVQMYNAKVLNGRTQILA